MLQEDSKTYANAKYLENFFEEQLLKWLPSYAKSSKSHHRSSTHGHNSNSSGSGASASPAPAGTGSPSLGDGGGRRSANSLSGDGGSIPAKRLRNTE